MIDRRQVLKLGTATLALPALKLFAGEPPSALKSELIQRAIPSSGELLPVIGMGTSRTFDTNDNPETLAQLTEVMRAFIAGKGTVIDSSPMYGTSEAVIGHCMRRLRKGEEAFTATKVWTRGRRSGIDQMDYSEKLWGAGSFDLMQIHNMVDWKTHLKTLRQWKEAGRLRYIGITTSHGRRHGDLEQALKRERFDFVQFTYNLLDREVEERLLPLAADRGIAVLINRPFRRGGLFDHVGRTPIPTWAQEFDCANWAQFFLKFVIAHPAVTCAIPATSRVPHMLENMGAGFGRLPDARTRQRMVRHMAEI